MHILPSLEALVRFLHARIATVDLSPAAWETRLPDALSKTAEHFAHIGNKYYRDTDGATVLRVAHYSQMAVLIYEMSRQAWLANDPDTADKLYFLNVLQSSCDLFYQVELPVRLYCDHPLGSVIGRAIFSKDAGLSFTTACTIGNNRGVYPSVQGTLLMMPGSAVLGDTEIRGTVVVARNTTLMDAGRIEDRFIQGSGKTIDVRPLDKERARQLNPFD